MQRNRHTLRNKILAIVAAVLLLIGWIIAFQYGGLRKAHPIGKQSAIFGVRRTLADMPDWQAEAPAPRCGATVWIQVEQALPPAVSKRFRLL